VDLHQKKTALVAGVAAAGIVTTAAVAMTVWPALTRPDPPAETSRDDGLRIRLVEPPKAFVAQASPLDVGLSQAAQAMAKGGEALFVKTASAPPPPAPVRARPAPIQVAQADEDEDAAPWPEPADDRWARDDASRDRFEQVRRQRWEEEDRLARQEREGRAAWEREQRDRRRWEEARARDRPDRYADDRYDPPPLPDEDRAPPGRW
jgi:hypothetical protein